MNLQASIVYNPTAQRQPPLDRVHGAALKWRSAGWDIDVRVSESAGHATVLAREAATSGAKVVFACGGDGTVNEVVNGLVGSDSALAVIRGGTSNVFASEIGVPWPLEKALGVLVDGGVRRFDLGMAGGRYFLMMAGIGFDASAVRHVSDRVKRPLGVAAYYLSAALELGRCRSHRVNLRIDDAAEHEEDLYWLVLGNTRSYAGVIDITSRALADDGYLDAYQFGHRGLPWMIANLSAFRASPTEMGTRRHFSAPPGARDQVAGRPGASGRRVSRRDTHGFQDCTSGALSTPTEGPRPGYVEQARRRSHEDAWFRSA